MAPNDLVALKANFANWQKTRGIGLTGINPFNYYSIENVLKIFPVNDKEIRAGAVDQSLDGGVDGFYFFANRKYVHEDTELDVESEYNIVLIIFQIKEGTGFSPIEIGKFIFFTEDLLDLNRQEEDYKHLYHQKLKDAMRVFKEQYSQIAGSVLSLNVNYYYISKLDIDEPKQEGDVSTTVNRLTSEVKKHFPKSKCNVEFLNAAKLFAQASVRKLRSKQLAYSSQTIQSDEGWIGLVDLRAFYEFLKDEHGMFHEDMLEENVRGYQKKTNVNEGIASTLRDSEKSAEFWVLNNGITILADQLTPDKMKTITIRDPQIVNGLQTSRNIFDYYKSIHGGSANDKRRLLVRIIETKDESVRDQIIRATNSQNKMPPEALRATDPIHRKIEEVFGQFGLFYDRRKGQYKDLGRPAAKIISVRDVLQATLAIALRRPNDARARPSDYLKDNEKYAQIFEDDKIQIITYLKCIEIVRIIESYKFIKIEYADHILNMTFYVALSVTCFAIKNAHVPMKSLSLLNINDITPQLIEKSFEFVFPIYNYCGTDDKAAKSLEMRNLLIKKLEEEIHGQ